VGDHLTLFLTLSLTLNPKSYPNPDPNPIPNPKPYPNPIPNPKPNPKCYRNRVRWSPTVLPLYKTSQRSTSVSPGLVLVRA